MKPEQFLASRWLLTRDDLIRILQERGCRSPATVDAHLARWKRQGRIIRVKAGLYLRTEPGAPTDGEAWDFLAIASRMAPDAVLASHTALEAHGYAQSLFEMLLFATWTKTKPLSFMGRHFVPVCPRAPLRRAGMPYGWTEPMDRSGIEVRVTTLERTVVDLFDRPDLAGGPDEVWRSCFAVPALDLGALEDYVTLLNRRILAAKVGYFLERRQEELVVPQGLLERLRRKGLRGRVYVDRRAGGRLAPGWNLMVPASWRTAPEAEPE